MRSASKIAQLAADLGLRGAGRSNAPGLPGELVGNYANRGVEWEPKGAPRRVNVHDFADQELGKRCPTGCMT